MKVFGGRAEAVAVERTDGAFAVAIHGLSFARPHAPESLLPRFKPPVDGAVNIGLMHTSLARCTRLTTPTPRAASPICTPPASTIGRSVTSTSDRCCTTACAIVMAGMPQGRDINEAGAKSVTLVTIADDRSIHIEERVTSVAQFERVPVDVTGIEDWRDMIAALADRPAAGARARAVRASGRAAAPDRDDAAGLAHPVRP